jgi:hypothetical protein
VEADGIADHETFAGPLLPLFLLCPGVLSSPEPGHAGDAEEAETATAGQVRVMPGDEGIKLI